MKYFSIVCIVISWIWVAQPTKDLYLLNEESPYVNFTYKANSQKAFFAYGMYYKGELEQRLFLFEPENTKRDTLPLSVLDSLRVRDYNWLQKDFLEYYHFDTDPTPRADSTGKTRYYNLNKFYDNIYIVIMDSSKQRAVAYKVCQDYLSDYEGWDDQRQLFFPTSDNYFSPVSSNIFLPESFLFWDDSSR